MEFTAEMIAGFLGGDIVGDKNAKVHTVSSIEEGKAGSLSLPHQSQIRTVPLHHGRVDRAGRSGLHALAAGGRDARQGGRRRSLRPETPRNVQRRQTPPQGNQRPRVGSARSRGGRRVLHRRLRGRRGGRAHRRGVSDLSAGLPRTRRHRSATTPRSTPG